jgi:hypothetical protein
VRLIAMAISVVSFCVLLFIQVADAVPSVDACSLPQDLQSEIATTYPMTQLVNLVDLSEDDREFFRGDHGNACPGLVKVNFYGDGKPILALVLIAKDGPKEKAGLVLAHQVGGHWQTTVLDTADGAPVPVVWSQPPGDYWDVYGKKRIRATRPVIVFAGYESWAILYAWTGKDIEKVWIAD